ncbi:MULTISPECIES: hypothetical protein [unclassified Streptomyces]|uniref:hypothetical protein n=1 Tax=unclassified Streptomyces TaxID=2593676 RepID=UPI0033E14CAC
MSAAHRRTTTRLLTAVAVGTLVLTGCGESGKESGDPTTPVAATTNAQPSAGESPSAETSPWAGTKQFVTIDRVWTEDGVTRLSVRPAQKEVNTQFDTWVITPGTGDFTTVTLTGDARVLLTTPVREEAPGASRAEPLPSSHAEFVTLVKRLDPALAKGIGYDLSFDGSGQVTKVQSLYRP